MTNTIIINLRGVNEHCLYVHYGGKDEALAPRGTHNSP